MPKEIISFGYRHGVPRPNIGERFAIIDVRACGFDRNPFHNRELRNLRGTDVRVQEDVKKTPQFLSKYTALRDSLRPLSDDTTVYLGCTGGRHRSVTLSILLSRDLGIICDHRDINKA